jgi:hypothetical protein
VEIAGVSYFRKLVSKLCCLALLVSSDFPAHAQASFSYSSPLQQSRYKSKSDAQQPGLSGQSQRWYGQALREYDSTRFDSALALVARSLYSCAIPLDPNVYVARRRPTPLNKTRVSSKPK